MIMQNYENTPRLIRLPQVIQMVGLSGSTIWRLEKINSFPKRIKVGAQAAAWLESEVIRFIDGKIEARKIGNEVKKTNIGAIK